MHPCTHIDSHTKLTIELITSTCNSVYTCVYMHKLCGNDAEFVCIEPEPSLAVIDDDSKNPMYDPAKAANDESKHLSLSQYICTYLSIYIYIYIHKHIHMRFTVGVSTCT